ncbi:MAG: hypothetical protein J6B60_04985 [Clostridia bacterium]|nr:hypothetical protein [Clostridia bacterium]
MRKLSILLTLCAIFTLSCADDTVIKNDTPKEITAEHTSDFTEYIVDTRDQKFHSPYCKYTYKIPSENKKIFNDLDFMRECGYVSCKVCLPNM